MTSRLRSIWLDILCCLLLQASLVAGGELLQRWSAADLPSTGSPRTLYALACASTTSP